MESIVNVDGECGECGSPWEQRVRLYNAREAADYCGGQSASVSIDTIRRWRWEGYIKPIWIGGINRQYCIYTKQALDECLTLKGYSNRIEESESSNGNTDKDSIRVD
jgi:hypothetical protein